MVESLRIDLNCDLGESFGLYELGDDAAMMPLITSANVACGFHAGDPVTMAKTAALAREHNVALGAHPGYPDLQGFGRRKMALSSVEIEHIVSYQLGALDAFARKEGLTLQHVKPHGALYNHAVRDREAAAGIARAVFAFNHNLILLGLAGSFMLSVAESFGLRIAREGFPDRRYQSDGTLMPRNQPDAVVIEPKEVARNAIRLVQEGIEVAGRLIQIDTLCLHGDNPHAVENARSVRDALQEAGIDIRPLGAKASWVL